ncbi:hypothetical protein BT63DRAFT_442759 [Microthyrium microscopicum]|uniref:DUF7137 domain-containing protein n=1 Tax=Microthyrium microscopicum TaxID=703497 RepID=A0A6A6TZS3_9PEZI|nr:hypothetical protein BT63DRAFT_442759 [Microthyrium microscopicum]
MRLPQFAAALSLITIAHAWPWPRAAENVARAVEGSFEGVFRRQNNGQATATATNTNTAATTNAPTNTATGHSISILGSGATGTAKVSNSSATTAYDPRDAPGGISMVTPGRFEPTKYYKAGDWFHFAWNYTSVQATPTAINIVAACSANQQTYTLAANMSYQPTGEIYWDTGAYQTSAGVQLLTNQYTLSVWDASQQATAAAKAGYLAGGSYIFGVYQPQANTPLADFKCPTCSGASNLEIMTWKALGGMAIITILTFTGFVTNFNVL